MSEFLIRAIRQLANKVLNPFEGKTEVIRLIISLLGEASLIK